MNRREFVAGALVLPFALRAAAGSAARGPVALVTADTEAHVAIVAGGRVVKRIATLGDPRSIEAVGGTAVVAHTAVGAITLLDGGTLSVRSVLRSFVEPRYTAGAGDGRHAFVTDSGSAELVTVDLERAEVVARLHLGAWPRHLSLDARHATLWVSLGNEARELALVDVSRPERPRLLARVRPPFLAHDVVVHRSGRHAWVTSGDRGALAVYDTVQRHVIARLPAAAAPQHVAFVEGVACVTSGVDGTLRLHAVRDGRLLRTVAIPAGSFNVQQVGGRILTPSLDRGTLSVLDGRGHLLERVQVAPSSHDACVL